MLRYDTTLQPKTRFQIAILADTQDRSDDLAEMASIDWLSCRQEGSSTLDFYREDEVISSLDLDNARLCLEYLLGIVVVGSADKFEDFKSKWNSALPSAGIALKAVPAWDPDAILRAAIDCITENLTLQRYQSGRAALELATYRREFDRLQYNFARLEQYIGSHSFRAANEIFEYTPEIDPATGKSRKSISAATNGSAGGTAVQSLPVDSLGLSSFSIYVNSKPEPSGEPLGIRLRAIETCAVVGEWSLNPHEVQIGWVELALNSAIDEFALSLELLVDWPPDSTEWALALGPPHPYKDFCVQTADGESLGAPMALRVYSNLPGVRVPPTTDSIRPKNALNVAAEFIPYAVYGTITQVAPPPQDDGITLVFYDREIGCLTVHPHAGGPTIARMNAAVPKNAWGISAEIQLAHEKASQTSFAIMVCDARDESRELARIRQFESPSPCFSGWRTLSPMETRSISVILPAFPEEQLSVFLLTRQTPGQSPDFGWARFSKIQFHLLPKSLANQHKVDIPARVREGAGSSDEGLAIKSIEG
jgi:hypothetical protein